MIYAWLCVDSDASEYICGAQPQRVMDIYDGVQTEYWFDRNMIELPIGTIKQLTNKEITWFDEAIPLEK